MDYLLELRDITKCFPGVVALDKVSLGVRPGEVHALVGENGAGKSTLIKIVTGAYYKDSGTILWKQAPVSLANPRDAQDLGIAFIHQHRNLIPFFSGVENLYIGRSYPRGIFGAVDWNRMREEAERIRAELHADMDLSKPISQMTAAQQTMVEVMRALLTNANLIILDEPTASFSDAETRVLFTTIQRLRKAGVAFIYVSHRLEEIFDIADRITVLRNGRTVRTLEASRTHKAELIGLMAGEGAAREFPGPPPLGASQKVLSICGLSTMDGQIRDISLDLRRGEILGLFGLVGSGRTALLEAIYGVRRLAKGTLEIDGVQTRIRDPKQAVRSGVVLVPEDRLVQGLVMRMSVRQNMTLPMLERFRLFSLLPVTSSSREEYMAREMIDRLSIKTTGPQQVVSTLSGGNQQKVVLGKWIARGAKVFLCDEPTLGVDVNARREIYRLIYGLSSRGAGIVVSSSDLGELLTISHRLGVMVRGRLSGVLDNRGLTPERVLAICYGEGDSVA